MPLRATHAIGLLAIVMVSGCATPEGTAAPPDDTPDYEDGTYSATADYSTPGGTESVAVEITLGSDAITAVTVTSLAKSPNAKKFQGQFIDGIAAVVVGKDIDELDVSRVSGSSLTSGGFNKALEQIKADALG